MILLYIVIYRAEYLDGEEYELVRAFFSEQRAKDYISNSDGDEGYEYEIKTVEWYVE